MRARATASIRDELMHNDSSEALSIFAPLAQRVDETLPALLVELIQSASDAIALINQRGECAYSNAAWSKIFGADGSNPRADAFQSLRPEDAKSMRDAWLETMRTGDGCAVRLRHPSDDAQYFECRCDVARGEHGGNGLVLAVVREVTAWHNAERRLREEVDY